MITAVFTAILFQTQLPSLDPKEVAECKAKGWSLREAVDDGTGIIRKFFVSADGKNQGTYRSWYKNGNPRNRIHFRDGKREALSEWWYENGKPMRSGNFRNDQLVGDWTYSYSNGVRSRMIRYGKNLPHGPSSFWTEDGKLFAKGSYRQGLPDSKWTIYESGNPRVYTFHDGVSGPGSDRPLPIAPKPPALDIPMEASKMKVKVDPRMELLAVIQNFTTWEQSGAFSTVDEPYKQDVAKWFGPFKNHEAIKLYQAILDGDTNFAFSNPVKWILFHGPLPQLEQTTPYDEEILTAGGGQDKLEQLRVSLAKFAKDTRFDEFFRSHQPFYDSLVQNYLSHSPGDRALRLVMEHYGEVRESSTVIICPLFGGGNYGVKVRRGSTEEIYNVGAPTFKQGKFTFSADEVQGLTFHEFGHSFSNPAVDAVQAWEGFEDQLFPLVRSSMASQAYGDWKSVVYELFDRTNEIRLVELYGNAKLSRQMLGSYVSERAFVWLPYTLRRLRDYECNRDKYKTFRDFAAEMKKVFSETRPITCGDMVICVVPRDNKSH